MKHNMEFKRKLPIPKEIKEQYSLTPELEAIKVKSCLLYTSPSPRD